MPAGGMKAKPVLPLAAYQVEAAILAHAREALSGDKPIDDIDSTQCIVRRQPIRIVGKPPDQ
jgi:hypothetical protein